MDEDVLGPRRTIVGERYDTCTRCGQPVLRSQAITPHLAGEGPVTVGGVPGAVRPLEATQDTPPPLLCPQCAEEIAAGEPLEIEDEDE
jgi:hypothetical protein